MRSMVILNRIPDHKEQEECEGRYGAKGYKCFHIGYIIIYIVPESSNDVVSRPKNHNVESYDEVDNYHQGTNPP